MHEILTIWRKELRDTVRDRRTLIVMVLVPMLLTPALIIGSSALARSNANKTLHVALEHGAAAPGLIRLLQAQPHIAITNSSDPAGAVKSGNDDAGLIIAPDFAVRVAAGGAGRLTIIEDSSQLNSSRVVAAITVAAEGYRTVVVARRLQARGINPTVLNPIATSQQDVASKQALAGLVLSLIVPTFLVIYSMLGGMYTAMDISAGEKERFTLEALLLSPATKLQITLGKLLAVSTVAVGTIVLALVSFFIALQRAPISLSSDNGGNTNIGASLQPSTILLLAFLGILLALSFSALELALSIFARSFKEAQSYVTPLYLLAVLPATLLGSIPGLKPGLPFYLIPAVNTVLVIKEALVGADQALHIVFTVITMLLFCVLAILVTLRIFSNERVLLRS